MPELPEVETIVRDLRPVLLGRESGDRSSADGQKFVSLESTHWKAVGGSVDFGELEGMRAVEVWRRGKFFMIGFRDGSVTQEEASAAGTGCDLVLTMHLRMSGRILIRDKNEAELKHERHRIDFENVSLRFCDQRKFGKIWLSRPDDFEADSGVQRLGLEPFGDEFTKEWFVEKFGEKRGLVKRWLLEQGLIAGVGNIYADEACFYAGVRPDARVENLSEKQIEALYEAVLKALKQGIKNRGTSISDYADAYGKTGRNQETVYVYGRGGEECFECGRTLVKTRVAGRGTVYCEKCQALEG